MIRKGNKAVEARKHPDFIAIIDAADHFIKVGSYLADDALRRAIIKVFGEERLHEARASIENSLRNYDKQKLHQTIMNRYEPDEKDPVESARRGPRGKKDEDLEDDGL